MNGRRASSRGITPVGPRVAVVQVAGGRDAAGGGLDGYARRPDHRATARTLPGRLSLGAALDADGGGVRIPGGIVGAGQRSAAPRGRLTRDPVTVHELPPLRPASMQGAAR
jgi:hypothetical protein